MSTLDLTVPHKATLNLTGLAPVVTNYHHTGSWPNVDSWSASSGVSVAAISGLRITVTGTSGTYITRTLAAGTGGGYRRIRARLALVDPEARPVAVRVTDNANDPSTGAERLVSGVPVWVEGTVNDGATSVRIYVTLPAGASSAMLTMSQVLVDNVYPTDWYIRRTDANGVATILGGPYPGPDHPNPGFGSFAEQHLDPDASGNLTFTDAEASLVGSVTYVIDFGGYAGTPDETLTGTLAKSGHAVLHRVHADAPTLHAVTLVTFSGTYPGLAEPVQILGSGTPTMPTAPLGSRQGSAALWFDTLDDAEAVAADLRTGEVMMLRQPAAGRVAMDAYLVATSLDVSVVLEELTEPKWALTATYVETARGIS